MKFKKIVSALLASVTALSMTICANAADGDATFCFDNDTALSFTEFLLPFLSSYMFYFHFTVKQTIKGKFIATHPDQMYQ